MGGYNNFSDTKIMYVFDNGKDLWACHWVGHLGEEGQMVLYLIKYNEMKCLKKCHTCGGTRGLDPQILKDGKTCP